MARRPASSSLLGLASLHARAQLRCITCKRAIATVFAQMQYQVARHRDV